MQSGRPSQPIQVTSTTTSPDKLPSSPPAKPTSRFPHKATLQFHPPLLHFSYYQNHLLFKTPTSVLIYNTLTRARQQVSLPSKEAAMAMMPPYLFVVMEERWILGYKNDGEPQRIRISKMEPRCVCRYNKGCYLGGYNRSMLPGNKRTTTRDIYYMEELSTERKNKPDQTIRIKDSTSPVSVLQVQNPYLFAYCQPIAYLISIKKKEILITFEKEACNLLLLQGRFAVSSVNGVGVSSTKKTIFTFDVQRHPLFGVQISETKYGCEVVCMQRTGRIFGAFKNQVYEYHPLRQEITQIVVYPPDEQVQWVCCTPSNSLMVLRNKKEYCSLDVFSLE